MWRSIWNAITSIGRKKGAVEPRRTCNQFSDGDDDDDVSSNEEALECPICWESFNIVENVPYVLWCGHTICKNCLLGLKWASLNISVHRIRVPLFVSCPWCNLLTLRLLFRGNLKAPNKNFFLLWMVESRNGDRFLSHTCTYHPQSRMNNTTTGHLAPGAANGIRHLGNGGGDSPRRRPEFSIHKSIDFFIRFTSRFPLVVVLVFMVIFAIPSSAAILIAYSAITVVFAVPAALVMYFAYPTLDWLVKEISS
ncbi:unnamed protein product [Cuscuta campestris]|uniref:RING-type domain-containing protein n=1 Tax=Cuscuta campestris TaxID=132261 RepID=A0A484N3Q7_9ASTE|nr:unnamed protein product [Cuscuta campestris]